MYTQPYPPDLLQHVRPCHEVLFSCKPHRPGCHQWKPMHLQVHDEIRELQPDVIVERYLDAKYYQHSPDQVQAMSECNSNATYLADSDQIVTLNAMETDDISISASLRDNLQELVNSVPEWESETQSINPKWLEHHHPDTWSKIQVVQYAWRKPAARSIIDASMLIDIQESCIVISQHLNLQQMVTNIV